MLTFYFQITENDYFESALYQRYTIPAYREQIMMSKYIILVCLLAFGAAWGWLGKDATYYIVFGIAGVLWLACYRQSFVENPIRKNIALMRRAGRDPLYHNITMTFEEERIISTAGEAYLSVPYSSIEKIITGENALYLYKSAIEAYIIPCRAFSGDTEKEAFLQFIKGKTNVDVIPGVTK